MVGSLRGKASRIDRRKTDPAPRATWARTRTTPVFCPKCGNAMLRSARGLARVPSAVRERAKLAKAKRSGSRRRPTRLISRAGYAREQARSSPPGRIFCALGGTRPALSPPASTGPSGRVPGPTQGRRARGGVTSDTLGTVQGAALLPPCRAGACPARSCDRALREPALRVDPGTPSASPPAPPLSPPARPRLGRWSLPILHAFRSRRPSGPVIVSALRSTREGEGQWRFSMPR
jgi:hypothetical protein